MIKQSISIFGEKALRLYWNMVVKKRYVYFATPFSFEYGFG